MYPIPISEDSDAKSKLSSKLYFGGKYLRVKHVSLDRTGTYSEADSGIRYSAYPEPTITVGGTLAIDYDPELYLELKELAPSILEYSSFPVLVDLMLKNGKVVGCKLSKLRRQGKIIFSLGLDKPITDAVCSVLRGHLEHTTNEEGFTYINGHLDLYHVDRTRDKIIIHFLFRGSFPSGFHLKNTSGIVEYDVNKNTKDEYFLNLDDVSLYYGKKHKTDSLNIYELKYRDAFIDVVRSAYESGHCETIWHKSVVVSYCPNDKYVRVYNVRDEDGQPLDLEKNKEIVKYSEELYNFFDKRIPDSSFVKFITDIYMEELAKGI